MGLISKVILKKDLIKADDYWKSSWKNEGYCQKILW